MKKSKAKKIILVILAVIIGLVALVSAAGVSFYSFYIKPRFLTVETEDGKKYDVNEILSQVEETLQEEDIRAYLNENNPNETEELVNTIQEAKERNNASKNENKEPPSKNTETENNNSAKQEQGNEAASENTSENKPAEEAEKSDSGNKGNSLKDKIDPKDLKDGMALAKKVDAGYILGLMSGGLTADERKELKSYLTSRLSSSEISRGIQLFSKYSYLL